MFDGTEDFEGKLTCAFKNDMKNLANLRSTFNKTFYTFLTKAVWLGSFLQCSVIFLGHDGCFKN